MRHTLLRTVATLTLAMGASAAPVSLVPGLSGPATAGATVAGQANTWVPTGSMATPRAGHTATLLTSGKVLIAGGGTAAAELYEPAKGTWSSAGSMSATRTDATATLLADGDVLVAGGCCTGQHALSSAELYDPTTNSWSLTGSMTVGRWGQSATPLADGDVLLAGGLACASQCGTASFYTTQRSAELYDPTTGTFTRTGSMHSPRQLQTATRMRDGNVLVAGGFYGCDDSFCTDNSSAEIYEAATGTWHLTGSMHVAREQQTATLLDDGQVLVAGGLNYRDNMGPGVSYSSAELYDPATGVFSSAGSMAVAHVGGSATLLSNGWALVAGGGTSDAELYQPSRGIWVPAGPLLTPRTDLTMTMLHDGTVLASGGTGPDGVPLGSAERFLAGPGPLVLLSTGTVSFGAQLIGTSSGDQSIGVTNVGTRPLLVSGVGVGGAHPADFAATSTCTPAALAPGSSCSVRVAFTPAATGLRSAEVSVVDDGPLSPQQVAVSGYGAGPYAWSPTGSMATARDGFASAVLHDGRVLIAGGEAALSPLTSAEVWDPVSGTWSATSPLSTVRAYPTAVTLPNGEVLVAGGYDANFARLASAELYEPSTGTWRPTGSMTEGGSNLTATVLTDGKVLVTGQGGNSAEVYDPSTGAWTDTGAMPAPQFLASAVLLASGKVLVVGGGTDAAELYDPGTNAWTSTGHLMQARQSGTATLLPDGKVLVVGGEPPGGGAPLTSAEVYDPTSGTFAAAQPMYVGRTDQSATLLSDGTVMVAGGCTGSCGGGHDTLSTTEFYNVQDGYWFDGSSMTVARRGFSAVLLPQGSVLAIGGSTSSCCEDTATAEVFDVPSISLSPAMGPAGQAVIVKGYGFDAHETVVVGWGSGPKPRATVTSTATGTFLTTLVVPKRDPGPVEILAIGQRSNARATATFVITGA